MVFVAAAAAFLGGYFLSNTSCQIDERSVRESDGFKVEWTDFQPPSPAPGTATVFILPPTGGTTPLDLRYAKGLCRDRRRVLIVQRWSGIDENAVDFDLHNRLFGRANRALNLVAARHPGPLHLLGTSLGALFSTSALVRIPQVSKAALVVGGVPFTEVIANSDTEGMTFLRDERKKKFAVASQDDYIARLNSVFVWNDLDKLNSDLIRDKQILLVIGLEDGGVPTKNQLQLLERFPSAQVIRHESDHFGTIVKSFLLDYYRIKNFLK